MGNTLKSIFLLLVCLEINSITTKALPNHIFYRKFDFNEVVHNSLCFNMGMIIFDLRGYGGCWRPKTSYLIAPFQTTYLFTLGYTLSRVTKVVADHGSEFSG